LDGLLAAAFLIRCFDRIVVTPQGVTAYRVGIPRRIRAAGLHQFQVIVKSAKWSRLYAQTVDGERIPIAYERRTPHGQARMRQLGDHLQMFLLGVSLFDRWRWGLRSPEPPGHADDPRLGGLVMIKV
jgi:hypothetical protein